MNQQERTEQEIQRVGAVLGQCREKHIHPL